jgi:2-dehydro-3-deoxygluconokinase
MSEVFASIGECMVELSPAGDGLYRRGFAGDTLNTAWTVRALTDPGALAVRYVSAVGDDALSRSMVRFIADAGIDTGGLAVRTGRTVGLYMITLTGAERSFTYWRDTSAARTLAADPAALAASLADVSTAYLSGITLAILPADDRRTLLDTLRTVRQRGGRVVFDPNVRMRLWTGPDECRSWITEGYRIASLALPTWPDERDLFGDDTPKATIDRVTALGVPEIAVKNGEEPALVAADGAIAEVRASTVTDPVDTTGAGDSFNAGYLAGRIAGLSPVEAAGLGHRVAGRVIMVRGALLPAADLADLAVGVRTDRR